MIISLELVSRCYCCKSSSFNLRNLRRERLFFTTWPSRALFKTCTNSNWFTSERLPFSVYGSLNINLTTFIKEVPRYASHYAAHLPVRGRESCDVLSVAERWRQESVTSALLNSGSTLRLNSSQTHYFVPCFPAVGGLLFVPPCRLCVDSRPRCSRGSSSAP